MDKDNSVAEKYLGNNTKFKKKQEAQKSLANYINQLKFHFELDNEELKDVLKTVFNTKISPGNKILKKWWQIWK